MKLYTEIKQFVDKEGNLVNFEQVVLSVNGFDVPIKPVFKSDRRLLLALVDREEKK